MCQWETPQLEDAYELVPDLAMSHRGANAIYLKRSSGLTAGETFVVGPAVIAHICGGPTGELGCFIAGCHLAPFKENASFRLEQLIEISKVSQDSARPVVIAGDMNMMDFETQAVLEHLNMQDAYIVTGSAPEHRYAKKWIFEFHYIVLWLPGLNCCCTYLCLVLASDAATLDCLASSCRLQLFQLLLMSKCLTSLFTLCEPSHILANV